MVNITTIQKKVLLKIMLLTKVLGKKFQLVHITIITMENLVNLKVVEITTHLIQKIL